MAKYANLVIITGHNAERSEYYFSFRVRKAVAEINRRPTACTPSLSSYHWAVQTHPRKSGKPNGHIRPFLLTKLLTLKILAMRTEHHTPRVVFVSSVGHSMMAGVDFGSLPRPDVTRYVPKDGTYGTQALKQLLRLVGKPDGIEAKTGEMQAGEALVWKTYRFTFSVAISVKMMVAWKSSSINTGESLGTKIRIEYDLPILTVTQTQMHRPNPRNLEDAVNIGESTQRQEHHQGFVWQGVWEIAETINELPRRVPMVKGRLSPSTIFGGFGRITARKLRKNDHRQGQEQKMRTVGKKGGHSRDDSFNTQPLAKMISIENRNGR
ncbi:hypothetical protein DFH08DRAFT_821699 [Mycena albidolilacea]|uniref:Uncharacterized protein n=1 Tax=Mycena albidolilacea TaxID=1033008 RepID=A0AAD6Z9A6_9AGAR|nr:hypothetical protein DFH08DRAFT_821699 [Mycena albidolilacea]